MFYIIWEVVFTIGDIPITAYPSVLTSDEGDRTKVLSLRPIGGMASGISTLAVQPIALRCRQFSAEVQWMSEMLFL